MYGFVGIFGRAEGKDHEGGMLTLKPVFDGLDSGGEHDGFGCKAIGGFNLEGGFHRGVETNQHIFDNTGVFTIFDFGQGTKTLHKA